MSDHVTQVETLQTETTATATPARGMLLALWAVTIFTSAFLLFAVQPILGKIVLPWFGGAAAVWTTALMFFQVTYLLGNLYAHGLIRGAAPRLQSRIHILLLAASLLLLPIFPAEFWKPTGGGDPTFRILGLLAVTIGLPFLLLSATSPLLQAWYVRGTAGSHPYRFYALSNAGSLLALLSYPVIVEPNLLTHTQAISWSLVYAGFVVLCATIAWRERTDAPLPASPSGRAAARPDWKLQLLWLALAADASALLLSITNHLSQNVAPVPLLWVVPLSLYLLSLILCFDGRGWYRRFLFLRLLAVAVGGMTYALTPEFANAGPLLQVPLFSLGLFICCMVCHGEMERLKPAPEHLTLFYLLISAGGAAGGIFVGIIAPAIFPGFYELPLAIGGCTVLSVIVLRRDLLEGPFEKWKQPISVFSWVLAAILVVSLVYVARAQRGQARIMARNFYGVLRVRDLPATGQLPAQRELMNGTIVHGLQFLDANRRTDPTAYFGPQSGAGIALQLLHQRGPLHAGVIGLGAGTLASYGRPGDRFTFYEINPLVIELSRTQFDFLSQSQADIEIVPGDARLSLEREPPRQFDILLVDAFSGDAIPVHLLTREAFALYFRHLKPQGVLVVHISNKFLDLEPVVQAAAAELGVTSSTFTDLGDAENALYVSTWMILTREAAGAPSAPLAGDDSSELPPSFRTWTDDYSNLLQILR